MRGLIQPEDEKRCDRALWLCLLYMVAFLAFMAWVFNGCAGQTKWQTADRVIAAAAVGGQGIAALVEGDKVCRPIVESCKAAKDKVCTKLFRCQNAQKQVLEALQTAAGALRMTKAGLVILKGVLE